MIRAHDRQIDIDGKIEIRERCLQHFAMLSGAAERHAEHRCDARAGRRMTGASLMQSGRVPSITITCRILVGDVMRRLAGRLATSGPYSATPGPTGHRTDPSTVNCRPSGAQAMVHSFFIAMKSRHSPSLMKSSRPCHAPVPISVRKNAEHDRGAPPRAPIRSSIHSRSVARMRDRDRQRHYGRHGRGEMPAYRPAMGHLRAIDSRHAACIAGYGRRRAGRNPAAARLGPANAAAPRRSNRRRRPDNRH